MLNILNGKGLLRQLRQVEMTEFTMQKEIFLLAEWALNLFLMFMTIQSGEVHSRLLIRLRVVMPSLNIRWINLDSLWTITDNLLIVVCNVVKLLLIEKDFLLCLECL